jgi:hypothetical protein
VSEWLSYQDFAYAMNSVGADADDAAGAAAD